MTDRLDTAAIRARLSRWFLPPGVDTDFLALCDEMDRLQAENERLTVERDHFQSEVKLRNRIPSMNDHVAGMQAEIERLRAALMPFAEADKYFDSSFGDDYEPSWAKFFNIGDFRRARAALTQKGN